MSNDKGLGDASSVSPEEGVKWSEVLDKNIDRELVHFRRLLPELLHTDKGKFVAIADGAVVGRDADEHDLANRMAVEQAGKFVLIQLVDECVLGRKSSAQR